MTTYFFSWPSQCNFIQNYSVLSFFVCEKTFENECQTTKTDEFEYENHEDNLFENCWDLKCLIGLPLYSKWHVILLKQSVFCVRCDQSIHLYEWSSIENETRVHRQRRKKSNKQTRNVDHKNCTRNGVSNFRKLWNAIGLDDDERRKANDLITNDKRSSTRASIHFKPHYL